MLGLAGCDASSDVATSSAASDAGQAGDQPTANRSSESPKFALSEAAAAKVRELMSANPGNTHLFVSVDFDDEKSCTGVYYHLELGSQPDESIYVLGQSQGVP